MAGLGRRAEWEHGRQEINHEATAAPPGQARILSTPVSMDRAGEWLMAAWEISRPQQPRPGPSHLASHKGRLTTPGPPCLSLFSSLPTFASSLLAIPSLAQHLDSGSHCHSLSTTPKVKHVRPLRGTGRRGPGFRQCLGVPILRKSLELLLPLSASYTPWTWA